MPIIQPNLEEVDGEDRDNLVAGIASQIARLRTVDRAEISVIELNTGCNTAVQVYSSSSFEPYAISTGPSRR